MNIHSSSSVHTHLNSTHFSGPYTIAWYISQGPIREAKLYVLILTGKIYYKELLIITGDCSNERLEEIKRTPKATGIRSSH